MEEKLAQTHPVKTTSDVGRKSFTLIIDLKKIEEEIREVKKQVKNMEQENESVISYSNSAHSFNALMRPRMKAINPSRYSNSANLMKDLITLKKHYNNNVPTKDQNDKKVFSEVLKDFDSMLEKGNTKDEKLSEESDDELYCAPKKRKRYMFSPADMFSAMFSPFGMPMLNPYSFRLPQLQPQSVLSPNVAASTLPPVKQPVTVTSTVTAHTESQVHVSDVQQSDHLHLLADAASTYDITDLNCSSTDDED